MSKKYELVADGIYKYASGVYFERPTLNGCRTWRSLKTSNLKLAREELYRRRSGVVVTDEKSTTTVGEIIRNYQKDDYPDQQRQLRPARMHELEERNCAVLLPYWDKISVDGVTLAECDRYHDWRVENIKRGAGHRAVDLDLNTLSNAFLWACRCELVTVNPLASRPRYCSEKFVHHCREYMPVDADELHRLAQLFFVNTRSEVLGWQALVEGQTGLRTCEALLLRSDAAPYTPGWITPNGKSLFVRRAKGQDAVNPFVAVHDGLRDTLDALFLWKQARFPNSPWYFPSPEDSAEAVGSTALAHALLRISPKLGANRKITSHGMRAFYVLVRRSHGISDVQIAYEIGHTTGGATIAAVYGGCPPNWLVGDGPKMSWLPSGDPAWKSIMGAPAVPQRRVQNTVAPAECHHPALAA